MNRRLEGPRLDSARLDTSGRGAQHAESLRSQPINRRRLNGIGKTTSRTNQAGAAKQSDRPEAADFQTSQDAAGTSLEDALIDFVMPRISDPVILRRSVSILQDCITHLVPNLDGGEQLKDLARTLMWDEIGRHRDLLGQLQGGDET
ncbi:MULTISPECIES: hypothetical protein [unclassified Mesorhizobium]|uniref:hypothetical protein n=1 Tax=unclassified Mesorhizobium TaxID=325217 RepID=UPI001FE21D0A|nr:MULTISPECIES: hypothetical protein [unclassified Mesorhizobium]